MRQRVASEVIARLVNKSVSRQTARVCRKLGHTYEPRIAQQWFVIDGVMVWEPIEAQICSRCGEFRRYDYPQPRVIHPNCRCCWEDE